MKIGIALTGIVAATMLALTGCGGATETSPENLVPDGATLIAKVQVADILQDTDLEDLYRELPKDSDDPQTLDALMNQLTEETGVDLRHFTELVLFADISRSDQYAATIAQGRFDEDDLVAAIERVSRSSVSTREYKGRQVHTAADDDIALSVLSDRTLVVGTPRAVESVIDVQEGDKDAASGEVRDAFDSLGGVLVRVALRVPPDAARDLDLPFGDIPIDLSVIRDLDIVDVAASKYGRTIRLEARGHFTSESSAREAGDALDAVLTLLRVATPDKETKELLNKVLRVSVDHNRVTLRFDAGGSEVKQLVEGLEGGLLDIFSSTESATRRVEVVPRLIVPEAGTPAPVRPPAAPSIRTQALILDSPHIPIAETATYSTTPPTSGPHWPATAQCGIYDEELPDELVVHNMEHGNVVISHNLVDPGEVRRLTEVAHRLPNFNKWGILRPYSNIRPGTVAMTAWGVMEQLRGVDEGQIERFFEAYHANRLSAESQQGGPVPCG